MPYNDFEDDDKTPVLQLQQCKPCKGSGAIGDPDYFLALCRKCEGRGLVATNKDLTPAR